MLRILKFKKNIFCDHILSRPEIFSTLLVCMFVWLFVAGVVGVANIEKSSEGLMVRIQLYFTETKKRF